MSAQDGTKNTITILLVDDIAETRENIKKLLAFEQDFRVIGTAGTGREAIEEAKTLRPDIIIMDINMPDMDGLQATSHINKIVPTSAVIIMSVQDDVDYFRRAMNAGARDFLKKPVDMDELYNTIRKVYRDYEAIRKQYSLQQIVTPAEALKQKSDKKERTGNILVVYSPQGGTGKTTIATNLASGLMKEGIRVLLADADLQFGDVPIFLNLKPQMTVVNLIEEAEDLDVEHFDNIVQTHESGMKVLLGPERPEFADEVRVKPGAYAEILRKVSSTYDFIVVDTASTLDEVSLALFDVATKIVLVGVPTLPCVKNLKFALDLFDKLEYPPDKTMLVLNKVVDPVGKNGTLSLDRIQSYLKRPVLATIPVVDEGIILNAIMKAVPVIASDRNTNKAPIRQLLDLADTIYKTLFVKTEEDKEKSDKEKDKKKSGLSLRLGR